MFLVVLMVSVTEILKSHLMNCATSMELCFGENSDMAISGAGWLNPAFGRK